MDKKKHYIGHRKRLLEKFLNNDYDFFEDYEILEMILMYAIPFKDVKPLAKGLLLKFDTFRNVIDASPKELMSVSGVGRHTVALFKLLKAAGVLYLTPPKQERYFIHGNKETLNYIKMKISGNKFELVMLIFLTATNKIIGEEIIKNGGINHISVDHQFIYKKCYEYGAKKIAIAHNHPSGDCNPTVKDLEFTQELIKGLKANKMQLEEHLIVSQFDVHSMKTAEQL